MGNNNGYVKVDKIEELNDKITEDKKKIVVHSLQTFSTAVTAVTSEYWRNYHAGISEEIINSGVALSNEVMHHVQTHQICAIVLFFCFSLSTACSIINGEVVYSNVHKLKKHKTKLRKLTNPDLYNNKKDE